MRYLPVLTPVPFSFQAWHAHHIADEEHEYVSIQRPLFDVHSFTSKQVNSWLPMFSIWGSLWFSRISSVFFFWVPSYIYWVHYFGWDFCKCDHFLIQPLRKSDSVFVDGACWVCLLPAFTHLRHKCQDLLSPCDVMHMCTDETSSLKEFFGEWSQNQCKTPREKSLLENFSSGGVNPWCLHQAGQRAQHTNSWAIRAPSSWWSKHFMKLSLAYMTITPSQLALP